MDDTQKIILRVALGILILAIISAIFRYTYFMKYEHFVCPKCHYIFKPKVLNLIFSENAVEGKIMRCPYCKIKSYMEPVKDKKPNNKM